MDGDVILTRDVTERRLRAGDVGTIVERRALPGVPEEGYSVEFFDMAGNTVAVVTLPDKRLARAHAGRSTSGAVPHPSFRCAVYSFRSSDAESIREAP